MAVEVTGFLRFPACSLSRDEGHSKGLFGTHTSILLRLIIAGIGHYMKRQAAITEQIKQHEWMAN